MGKRILSVGFLIFIIASAFSMILWSKEISDGIILGIRRCITVIIPSMYGFLIISGFLVRSGLYSVLSKPFYPISKYIFHLEPELFLVFILSQIGGYPLGAKLICDLVNENRITEKYAESMMVYCYGGGPAFLAGTVGVALFGSARVGIYVFLAVISANTILALIIGRLNPVHNERLTREVPKLNISFNTLIDSVMSAARSLFSVCAMIVFFSAVVVIITKAGLFEFAAGYFENKELGVPLLKSFIEISYISELPASQYGLLPFIAASISGGGICILMQIKTIVNGNFRLKKFLLLRPAAMALSFIFMKIYSGIFAVEALALHGGEKLILSESTNGLPSILLIIMTILLFAKKNVAKS